MLTARSFAQPAPKKPGFADRIMIKLPLEALIVREKVRPIPINSTGGTMRSILILAIFGTLLLQPTMSFADANAECLSNCANEKATRDANCPSGEDSGMERGQCLRESQETYKECINGCPQPTPPDT